MIRADEEDALLAFSEGRADRLRYELVPRLEELIPSQAILLYVRPGA